MYEISKSFYRSFEDRYRGSRELIKSRLQVYAPFVEKLKEIDQNVTALDLGCGRGEWLELLSEKNVQAYGIDTDEAMLEACINMNLKVQKQDVLEALQSKKENSYSIISGFHIVEHLPFDVLHQVIQEALRVLKPGGLLILETPNPENIKVATESFYLDPTHMRPIPQQLLSFMVEFYGFERTVILRLQELIVANVKLEDCSLMDVLAGVSCDYAVVAQKKASSSLIHAMDELFSKSYGVSLEALAKVYEERIRQQELFLQEAWQKSQEAWQKSQEAWQKSQEAWQQYELMLNSNSWKITKPLRVVSQYIRQFIQIMRASK